MQEITKGAWHYTSALPDGSLILAARTIMKTTEPRWPAQARAWMQRAALAPGMLPHSSSQTQSNICWQAVKCDTTCLPSRAAGAGHQAYRAGEVCNRRALLELCTVGGVSLAVRNYTSVCSSVSSREDHRPASSFRLSACVPRAWSGSILAFNVAIASSQPFDASRLLSDSPCVAATSLAMSLRPCTADR
jgi:hypothetical protein